MVAEDKASTKLRFYTVTDDYGEELGLDLPSVGTLTMIPIFIGYDIITSCTAKWLYLVGILVRILNWVPGMHSKEDVNVSKCSKDFNKEMRNNKNLCHKCNRIVCVKHSKSGCGDCLNSNKLMLLT